MPCASSFRVTCSSSRLQEATPLRRASPKTQEFVFWATIWRHAWLVGVDDRYVAMRNARGAASGARNVESLVKR